MGGGGLSTWIGTEGGDEQENHNVMLGVWGHGRSPLNFIKNQHVFLTFGAI